MYYLFTIGLFYVVVRPRAGVALAVLVVLGAVILDVHAEGTTYYGY